MRQKNTVWVLSEVFYPEEVATAYIITEIADCLAAGRKVSVICGPASYEKQSNKSDKRTFNPGLRIQRVRTIGLNKNNLFLRSIRMILITFAISSRILVQGRRGDKILVVTSPAFLLLLIGIIVRLRKFKLYVLVHDIFPENVVAAGVMKADSVVLKALKKVFDYAYSRADVLIVLGRDMDRVIRGKISGFRKTPSIEIIENWAEPNAITLENRDDNPIIQQLCLSNKIVFTYTGNLGRVQGLLSLLSVIRRVGNPILYFLFIGEGAVKAAMLQYVSTNKLSNVQILNYLPRKEQNIFLNACDVSIVSLADNMLGLGVPSKSYNIMAAGKPILFIGSGESEISLMIKEFDNGWTFEAGEEESLVRFFNSVDMDFIRECREKGLRSRKLAETKFAKTSILEKFTSLLS